MNLLRHTKFRLKADMEFITTAEMGDLHVILLQDETDHLSVKSQDLLTRKEMDLSVSHLKEKFIYTGCPANLRYLMDFIRHEGQEPCSQSDKFALATQLESLWVK